MYLEYNKLYHPIVTEESLSLTQEWKSHVRQNSQREELMTIINEYQNLTNEIAGFVNTATLHPDYLFRGQPNAQWNLEPSFTRIVKRRNLNRSEALQLERRP